MNGRHDRGYQSDPSGSQVAPGDGGGEEVIVTIQISLVRRLHLAHSGIAFPSSQNLDGGPLQFLFGNHVPCGTSSGTGTVVIKLQPWRLLG